MELVLPENFANASDGTVFKEFKLNSGMAMMLLREKIYKNSKRAMVQEYMSNARDANREAGRPTEPIKVHGPRIDSPDLVFEDHGVGITPYRMENFFTAYGESTKRNTNGQTGGWGLGCKAAFAVSDSFQVETVWDDEEAGKRMHAIYLMAISSKQTNIYTQLVYQEAEEGMQTGTKVRVPVDDDDDLDYYMECAKDIAYYWGHPSVPNSAYPLIYDYRYGEKPSEPPTYDLGSFRWESARKGEGGVILDGIRYRIDERTLKGKDFTHKEVNILSQLSIFFNTGEVMVTATREDIDYASEGTMIILKEALSKVYAHYGEELSKRLEGLGYMEASWEHHKEVSKFGTLFASVYSMLQWKDPASEESKPFFNFEERIATTNRNSPYHWDQRNRVSVYRVDCCYDGVDYTLREKYEGDGLGKASYLWETSKPIVIITKQKGYQAHIRGALQEIGGEFTLIMPHTMHRRKSVREEALPLKGDGFAGFLKEKGLDWIKTAEVESYPKVAPPATRDLERKKAHGADLLRVAQAPMTVEKVCQPSRPSFERSTRSVHCSKGGIFCFFKANKLYHDAACTKEVIWDQYAVPLPYTYRGNLKKEASGRNGQRAGRLTIWAVHPSRAAVVLANPNWVSLEQWAIIKDARILRYAPLRGVEEVNHLGNASGSYRTMPNSADYPWDTPAMIMRASYLFPSKFCLKGAITAFDDARSLVMTMQGRRPKHPAGNVMKEWLLGQEKGWKSKGLVEILRELKVPTHALEELGRVKLFSGKDNKAVGSAFELFRKARYQVTNTIEKTFPLLSQLSFSFPNAVEVKVYCSAKLP